MNRDVQLWIAKQIWDEAFVDIDGMVAYGICRFFDIYPSGETGSYNRRKVQEMLQDKYEIYIVLEDGKWVAYNTLEEVIVSDYNLAHALDCTCVYIHSRFAEER